VKVAQHFSAGNRPKGGPVPKGTIEMSDSFRDDLSANPRSLILSKRKLLSRKVCVRWQHFNRPIRDGTVAVDPYPALKYWATFIESLRD
jgi:hypothetical protein